MKTHRPQAGRHDPHSLGPGYLRELDGRSIVVVLSTGRVLKVPMGAVHDDSELYGRDVEGQRQADGTEGVLVVKRGWATEQGLAR